jgi:hypothetical protein
MRFRLALFTFVVLSAPVAQGAWPPAQPSQLILTVRETAGIARTGEIVRTGIPLPRSLNVTSTASLAVVNALGQPVPAQFRILARWNAGRSVTSASIQWLMVIFAASVPANQSATFRLVFDGSNPAPATPLTLAQNGNQITVNTGAATFVLGGSSGALFDSITLANGTPIVSGSTLTGRANNADFNHSTTRRVAIEHSGPLSAAVIIEGAYDLPALGSLTPGVLGSMRRYVFSAGSPVATVRQSMAWEGTHCERGEIECNGAPNGVRVQRVRDALSPALTDPLSATAVGAFETTTTGTIANGQTAAVRQLMRNSRGDAQSFTMSLPGLATINGTQADGGMLAAGNDAGTIAVALEQMHRYEPQALRVLSDGRMAIDLVDSADVAGSAWLGARQGLFATLAVGALPASPSRATLDRQLWAPLHRPLRAWPSPEWIAASDAVDEFPIGALANDFAAFDAKATAIHDTTLDEIDARGLAGVMTFGLYPRNWANPLYSDEIDCGGNDITPAESWDEPYWCATWTDYHNTVATIPAFVFRNGQAAWLDELAAPGALRSLHTQIFQCGPNDTFFYCAQAPAGYGGYRQDFNSSHAYLENLMLHYWLTGDSTIVDMLQRGATSMRNYYCDSRPASACAATDAPTDDYANVNGRVFVQWHSVFRFVGLAGDDASFLDDYRANIARQLTHNYAEVLQDGVRYGFLADGTEQQTITGPGTYSTDQLWMASLYDMNLLYRLQRDTNDTALGSPSVIPSQVIAAWARTLNRFGSRAAVGGDGTAAGTWPNALFFTFTGNRIGGTLTNVAPNQGGGDPSLYDTGKAALTATITRAADSTGDAELGAISLDLARYAWNAAEADPDVLGKSEGEFFSRQPSAIARISLALNPPAPSSLEATATSATSISITWNASAGATSYRLYRRSAGGGFTQIATPVSASFTDTVTANTAHLYRAVAVSATGVSSESNTELATAVVFADDPIVAGTTIIKRTHVTDLRTAADAVRALATLGVFSFTDATLALIRRVHVTELRTAIDEARAALALPALTYTDPELAVGGAVRAPHVTELRTAAQ